MSENTPKATNVEIVNKKREIDPRDRLLKITEQKPKSEKERTEIRNNWMTPF